MYENGHDFNKGRITSITQHYMDKRSVLHATECVQRPEVTSEHGIVLMLSANVGI
jgi:hypothetical protein